MPAEASARSGVCGAYIATPTYGDEPKISYLIGQPIGISLTNGQGTSGILCGVSGGKLVVMEYLYQAQFAVKQYDFYMIQDINGFPPCHQQRLY